MKVSDLILAIGDANVKIQNLDHCADDLNYSAKLGTKITFGTDQPLNLGGTEDLGLVVWLPRALVSKAMASARSSAGEAERAQPPADHGRSQAPPNPREHLR